MSFLYGPDEVRKKTQFSINRVVYKTKYYIGSDCEIEKFKSAPDRKMHYLIGGDGLFAIYVQQGNENIMYYIYKDYLGSIYCITSDNGIVAEYNNVEQIYSFDPWGRRRNHTDWTYENVPVSFLFDRGFTGHEHLDVFNLINMNGRVYDPWLGCFISPDPFVQAPENGQNFNRYSYALNNPLKYADPNGEFLHLIIGAIIGGTMNLISNWGNIDNFWQGLGYFGVGAVAGAAAAGVGAGIGSLFMGGSFGAGFLGTCAVDGAYGFITGASMGGAAGATNGFITGTGNSVVAGKNLGESLSKGIDATWRQALIGATFGGIGGGIAAAAKDRNFWTGEPNWKGALRITSERIDFNIPEQRIELNTEGLRSKLNPWYENSSSCIDDEGLHIYDNYSDGTQVFNDLYLTRCGSSNYSPLSQNYDYSITHISFDVNIKDNPSYFRDGIGWFAKIEPYRLPNGHYGYSIHPDGNSLGMWWLNDGTAGCPGIQENALRLNQLSSFIQNHINRYGPIPLRVYWH
ncbi:MAG: RHS repeat-associated core domain-containing protein [Bacteroidetes bacterium]|nr:RHS repeat-associated core domain-containing protein [Bacteroidota bacterium]